MDGYFMLYLEAEKKIRLKNKQIEAQKEEKRD